MRLLLAALLLLPSAAVAQEIAAVRAARDHFRAAPADARLATSDLDDLRAISVHQDARTGVTFVTMAQHVNGLEVFGTASGAAVTRTGRVSAPAPAFEAGAARRAGGAVPALDAVAAEAVARDAALEAARALPPRAVVFDDPDADRRADPALEADAPRLGYHVLEDGALRLAYEVTVSSLSGPTLVRSVVVDAVTGAVLEDVDLVEYDSWHHAPASTAPSIVDVVAGATSRPVLSEAKGTSAAAVPSYRVVPAPFESPSRSPFVLVANPADPVASPLGWHSTGSVDYTVTRGNNVYAYTDTDDDNSPDFGSAPDGGAELVFDFPFDLGGAPADNAPAAVTNLFYWNNVVHDVLYRYGFDEAAGNFQAANLGDEGEPNDAVRAEALDGSGTNNANFGTPSDGGAPRMQMFRWTGAVVLDVTAPEALEGSLPSLPAAFGPGGSFEGQIVQAGEGIGDNTACTASAVTNAVAGRVALIERGGCNFDDKIANAGQAGAVGAIVYNRTASGDESDNGGDVLVSMGGDGDPPVNIPSVFIRRSAGLALIASTDPVEVAVTQEADRASSFDAGIITHEYGHGISNRLIGGPAQASCLRNGRRGQTDSQNRSGEQMGEGWSDYYGLMLTQREGDVATQPRGVGTFVQFEIPDGPGIRPAPYSTDFAINDYTYQDVIDGAGFTRTGSRFLSIPHGVGFAWATVLWEMTWDLIEAEGFDPDVANADGTAGNQIALNLVTTGLKLTPCTPGFVDGRDAILAADAALYPDPQDATVGRHHDLIWAAFARRGLGVNADQGASTEHNDGRSDFTTPPPVNDPPNPTSSGDDPSSAFEVSAVSPNPASRAARVAVSVDRAQDVEVVLFDALGRQVRREARTVAAGMAADLEVDLEGLPAGVYALRVTGETATETRSLTVVR